MKYLKKFENHTKYRDYVESENFVKPNESFCEKNKECHLTPYGRRGSKQYLTFVALEDGTFKFSGNSINYSVDNGKTWTSLASNTNTPTVTAGRRILWKANGLTPSTTNGVGTFLSSGKFNVEGNIMSLVGGDDFENADTMTDYQFRCLFSGCTNLISAEKLVLPPTTTVYFCYGSMFSRCTSLTIAPQLPATTLAERCYIYMFDDCTSLTNAPKLPATTLSENCYAYMFRGCTSLTTAPELPATTLADGCYNVMFSGCTSLTIAPELPATTLTSECYQYMFQGCSSLSIAPELPATTLASYCYGRMFSGCTSLKIAPELPATTLADWCYYGIFGGCTSLTFVPELPATTLVSNCYRAMFEDCTSLNYIKALFTTEPSTTYTYNWVNGVSSTGTFVKNSSATWDVTGANGVPAGWIIKTAT